MTLKRVQLAWLALFVVAMACAAMVAVQRQQCDEQVVRAPDSIASHTWACA